MTLSPKLRAFLPMAGVAVALVFASQAHAAWFGEWFGWGAPTTVTTGYAPGYGYYYAPAPAYRTLYSPAIVTGYQPVGACNTCGAGAVTSYYVARPNLLPYRAYRPIYAPACATCGTAYYAPAPACGSCGCASCGCASCGCATGGCSTCGSGGCATCGFAPPACPTCGGGCASGACGAAMAPAAGPVYSSAPSAAPTLSYMTPSSSYPVAAAYAAPVQGAPLAQNYGAPAYAAPTYAVPTYASPSYVVPSPSLPGGSFSPTYAMPPLPGNSTPTLAPTPGPTPADVVPSISGPTPGATSTLKQISPAQPGSASPNTPAGTPKTFEQPDSPIPPPAKPIPDNRNSSPPSANGSHGPIDPNSRTASSMPMLRPGTRLSTPWPIAKTTAALMPVVPDNADADGWHAAR